MIDRRTAIERLGAVGLLGAASIGTARAHVGCGDHLADGAVLDCYVARSDRFDTIYEDMNGWEHQFVSITHSDWDGTVDLRVGEVSRVPDRVVHDLRTYYEVEGNGESELGDDRQVMLAGDWPVGVHNHWNLTNHVGLVNANRCVTAGVALKYWYHEIGHVHALEDRTDDGALMAPGDWLGMRLTQSETDEWCAAYVDGCTRGAITGDEAAAMDGVVRTEVGLVTREAGPPPDADVRARSVESPTAINSRPL